MFLAVVESDWPNSLDKTTVVVFCLIAVGLPLLGYIGMVLDIRAYLRSLRRALVRVAIYLPDIPAWAVRETPSDLRALGLRAPGRGHQAGLPTTSRKVASRSWGRHSTFSAVAGAF